MTLVVNWLMLMWLAWMLRRRALRFLETQKRKAEVGTKWEQIEPMEECFDFYGDREDDL